MMWTEIRNRDIKQEIDVLSKMFSQMIQHKSSVQI